MSLKHYFLLAADALSWTENIAGVFLCFMQLLPYMKAFQGERGNITYSSLHTVALKNSLMNHLMVTIGALPLLWSENTLGSWVVLCALAGDWLPCKLPVHTSAFLLAPQLKNSKGIPNEAFKKCVC